MLVFRLSKAAFCRDLSGSGAKLYGGRWNSKGKSVLYTSESRALCCTEVAVHMPLGLLPKDYFMASIDIPDKAPMDVLDATLLPSNWQQLPQSPSTQTLGDAFLQRNEALVFKVPSATVAGEFNYLINPMHPMIKKVRIVDVVPFSFDKRLFIR